MRKIGLIGGMSFESTAVYYRQVNALVRAQLGGLHSADILMRSFDFARVVAHQSLGEWDAAATMLADAAEWLVRGGADGVLICTNTMHLVAPQVASRIATVRRGARLINIIDETALALRAEHWRRPLLLATRPTMEQSFYNNHMRRHGIETLVPDAADRQAVHDMIFDELCQGVVLDSSRERLMQITARGLAAGADCVSSAAPKFACCWIPMCCRAPRSTARQSMRRLQWLSRLATWKTPRTQQHARLHSESHPV